MGSEQMNSYGNMINIPHRALFCLASIGILLGGITTMGWADDSAVKGASVAELLEKCEVAGGVVVHVGCGEGEETADLASKAGESFLVQGLDTARQNVENARRETVSRDLGGRLTFKQWTEGRLPYADNIVNVLFWDNAEKDPDMGELKRVLVPHGKVFVHKEGKWRKGRKSWPADMDDWSHYRYDAGNTGGSNDKRVGPPDSIQWEAGPRFMRSHEIETGISSVVTTSGRIYYILDEGPIGITDARFPAKWSLVCRNAFNGVLLWKRPLEDWGWQSWKKKRQNIPKKWMNLRTRPANVDRLMVAEGDILYAKLGFRNPVSAIDGRSGEVLRTYKETKHTKEFIVVDGILLAFAGNPKPAITAVRADNGEVLWRHESSSTIKKRSLCAAGRRVFYHGRGAMVALDLETGEELWKEKTNLKPSAVMASEDAVIAAHSRTTLALSPKTGERLWKKQGVGTRGRQPDLFIVDDQVWWGKSLFKARNIQTGKDTRKMELQSVLKSGHHRRCYTDRASANYLITGERGSEFLDLQENDHMRHNWLRGPCVSGMTPANGLFYVPPHQCFCYPAIRMDGFFALSSQRTTPQPNPQSATESSRLEKGPAYTEENKGTPVATGEWPMYRQNAKRSGSVDAQIPSTIAESWSTELGGSLTQPVVAGGRLFVAQKDAGVMHCLDIETGERSWSYAAAGKIDSSPSCHNGYLLFGSHDGSVYKVRAQDGKLAWRFRAAPQERQMVSYNRLSSAWPVHGSVLIQDGLVYCAAGRSSFLDGGIYLYALDAKTGELAYERNLEGPLPDISKRSPAFHDDGYRADLLTTDGKYIYMGRTVLDRHLKEVEPEKIDLTGQQRGDQLQYRKMPGMRLVATGGFLDHTFFNRTWWMYSRIWPSYFYAQQAPKSGQMLVFDDQHTYTVKHYSTRNRHSPMFFPGNGYLLFADENDNEPVLYRGEGEPKPIEWEPELPKSTRWSLTQDAARDKCTGFTRVQPTLWTEWVNVRIKAMVLAGEKLFVAGPPDVVPEDDPLAGMEGRAGGKLRAVSAENGEKLHEIDLDNPPVFDGLIAADGALYMSGIDGKVIKFSNPDDNR